MTRLSNRLLAGWLLPVLLLPALPAQAALKAKAVAKLSGLDGKPRGTATFEALNRGVLITPFHNMMLVCPDTTEADVTRLLDALDDVLAQLTGM